MPVTLKELAAYIEEANINHGFPEEYPHQILLKFTTLSYTDTRGDHSLILGCAVSEDGGYLEIYASQAYSTTTCKYKSALFASMLQVAYMTKYLQLEHDQSDGEVRLAIDMPVLDGAVTKSQLLTMIFTLVALLEEYHPVFVHAMSTGKIDFDLAWAPESEADDEEAAPTSPALSPDLQALIAKVGGLDKLEALVAAQRAAGNG